MNEFEVWLSIGLMITNVSFLCLLRANRKRINILQIALESILAEGNKQRLCVTCSRKMIYPLWNTCCWDCQNRLFISGNYGHYMRRGKNK